MSQGRFQAVWTLTFLSKWAFSECQIREWLVFHKNKMTSERSRDSLWVLKNWLGRDLITINCLIAYIE